MSSIPGEGNGELSEGKLTFQPPEEGQSVQWSKWDKHGDKGEDNITKNVNNVW